MKSDVNSNQVRVWDLAVRLFHWSLVTAFFAAYLIEKPRDLHEALGYVVFGLIGFRLIWGFVGSRHARFAEFVPGPRRLFAYLRDMFAGGEARYLGHNPAGGAMILTLLATLTAIGVSGYMMGMDAYFGAEWVEDLHEALVSLALVLVALHLAGVAFSSLRHKENLVRSMLTGLKSRHEEQATDD